MSTPTTPSAESATTSTTSPQPEQQPQTPSQDERVPIFIDLADSQAVHVTLDEQLTGFLSYESGAQPIEDNSTSTLVLILSFISIAIVGGLHFGEWKFGLPQLNQFTLPCVIAFFLLQFYLNFFVGERGLLFRSQPYKLNGSLRRLDIYVNHQPYNTDYFVKMDLHSIGSKKANKVSSAEATFQITSFFNTNGRFLDTEFYDALRVLYHKAIDGKKEA